MSKKLFTTSIGEFVTSQAEEIKKEDIARAVSEIMEDYKKYDRMNADIEISIKTLPNDNGFRITYKSPTLKKKLYVPAIFAPQVAQLRTMIGMRFKDIFGDFGLQGFTPESIVTSGPDSNSVPINNVVLHDSVFDLWYLISSDLIPGKKVSEKTYAKMVKLIETIMDVMPYDDNEDDTKELTEEELEAMPYTDDDESDTITAEEMLNATPYKNKDRDMHEMIMDAADQAIEEMTKDHTDEA